MAICAAAEGWICAGAATPAGADLALAASDFDGSPAWPMVDIDANAPSAIGNSRRRAEALGRNRLDAVQRRQIRFAISLIVIIILPSEPRTNRECCDDGPNPCGRSRR
ncbi:MAG TPA: hypothetical protein VFK72_12355 [Nevskia sp.]|nr:hypothetical protein [Nevskia sp.]